MFFHLFFGFFLIFCFNTICDSTRERDPPKLLSKQSKDENKKIIKSGHSIALQCPVEKSKNEEFYFEWYKNGNPIENFDERIRITDSGVLKIKSCVSEDTGRFVCKAINGFGSVQFSVTLIVLDEDYDDMSAKEHIKSVSPEYPPLTNPTEFAGRPQLTQISEFEEPVIKKKTGSSIRLKCVVTGNPKPSITWFHNNEQFTDSEPRKGRNSLVINGLKPEDSGNYTCLSTNPYGTVSHSYVLKVIDNLINKPEIEGNDSSNTSVVIGQTATLDCTVRSDELPHIQWLKKIEIISDYGEEAANYELTVEDSHYIKLMGELYKTLDSTKTIQTSDTLFVNNYIINNINDMESGKYLCLAVNTMGSTFKTVFLSVLTSQPNRKHLYGITRQDFLPIPIVVAIVSVVLIVVIALLVWMAMCLCQKPEPNTRTIEYESGSKHTVCLPSESNSTYNQMLTNKYQNIGTNPSSSPVRVQRAQRSSSPFYSELITNDKRLSNVYQLYTNPKDLKPNHFQSNKPYGHLC